MEQIYHELHEIVEPLLKWYKDNARDLPWRKTKNPYHIWVSEIMLQQTRVEAVKPYYAGFLAALPTVKDLAEAQEDTILKLWEGLGYYSRVRNMQEAAKEIVRSYNGDFPKEYEGLLKLKGIGTYTAGAVASIAFSLPYPAVDGNVLRVMARLSADSADISLAATKKVWEGQLKEIMPQREAGEFNQAIMELGATVCLPNGGPKCGICPLREFCEAYKKNMTEIFPVKSPKKERRKEHRRVFFITDGEKIAIQKRGTDGLLSGLWELPGAESVVSPAAALLQFGIHCGELKEMKEQKHIFTHVEWHMSCYFVKTKNKSSFLWVTPKELKESYSLPSAFKKAWQEGCLKLEEENELSGSDSELPAVK